MAKKPKPEAIRAAPPLTASSHRQPDPMARCNVCGEHAQFFKAWRECDERDKSIAGPAALVFIADGHKDCAKKLDAHPRLYVDVRGDPGSFPLLCGPCVHRGPDLSCAHPKLKKNGGEGLTVKIGTATGFGGGMIICSRGRGGGCWTPPTIARDCEGRRVLQLAVAPPEPPSLFKEVTAAAAQESAPAKPPERGEQLALLIRLPPVLVPSGKGST